MASSTSSSSDASDSEGISTSSGQKPRLKKQEDVDSSNTDSESDKDSSEDETSSESNNEDASNTDAPVLSHAAQRRQKKKELKAASNPSPSEEPPKKKQKVKNTAELAPSKIPKRQNSMWVGNLAFKTTPEALRQFFDGVGEITRIHMPMKMVSGPPGAGARKENRGFAYVDFATPDAKTVAITLSENPLDGRRLLIKDGDNFDGRPTTGASAAADEGSSSSPKANLTGHTKTAQKILRAQKQPPGPTLFLGNLGFETTEQSIRAMLDFHRGKAGAHGNSDEAEAGPWIRKVRLGTFEDSGKCKGWAFVDFTSTDHATSALVDPKTHFLDGRKLVVEYASPDAVRRGGGMANAKGKSEQNGGTRPERPRAKAASDAVKPSKRKARTDETDADAVEQIQDSPTKKRRVEKKQQTFSKGRRDGKPPRARAKPGAALALAKREAPVIVPSQGRKIVF
ncbi:hypothetical protein AcV5_000754 [Taiwanofungus camphoratus]|nr:hypothetical protein AcV5_000754 [Antrodia cinnamomea]